MTTVKFKQNVTTSVTDRNGKATPVGFEAGKEVEVDLKAIAHVDPASYDVLDGAPKTTEMTEAPVKK